MSKQYEIYKNMMSPNPIFDKGYIGRVLSLPVEQTVNFIEISEVIESNTALVIRIIVQVNDSNMQPKKLFIKTIKGNQSSNVYHSRNMREGKFYRAIKEHEIISASIPKCHDVFISEEKGEFLIVLDDVSDMYSAPNDKAIQESKAWYSCVESLAKLHATFWNHKIIEATWGEYIEEMKSDEHPKKIRERVNLFINEFSNTFDTATKETLEKAMKISIKQIKETAHRIIANNNVTICNGDSHIHNFMLPNTKNGNPLIVDFQFWGEGIGTGDLAHLTRVKFSDELKREIQIPLVEHYHKVLLANGIEGYSWDNCLRDYQMSIASMVLIPMWQYTGFKIPYDKWKDDLQGLVYNFKHMKCEEILL